jgi:hypothetical protein
VFIKRENIRGEGIFWGGEDIDQQIPQFNSKDKARQRCLAQRDNQSLQIKEDKY